MTTLKPKTDRKIRCDLTNALKSPDMYDMSGSLAYLADAEAKAKPLKKPRFFHRTCNTASPVYHPFTRETGITRLLYCVEGQALLIADNGQTSFITAGSIIVIPHNEQYDLLLGRGSQRWITVHWEPESHFVPGTQNIGLRKFMVNSCSAAVRNLTDRVVASGEESEDWQNLTLSWINLVIHESHTASHTFALAPRLDSGQDSLQELVAAIKVNPEADWNLNAAAKQAGYSPFHLSRVFRSSIGVGLPKFVECCRTEVAIERLLNDEVPINTVAQECGFGSSQAMRSAIREFTGFLPIELRGRSGE